MTIGGKREGAGRPGKWNGPTKMIRLPEKHEAAIIEYARLLDYESDVTIVVRQPDVEPIDFDSQFKAELEKRISRLLMATRPRDRMAASKLLQKLLLLN